MREKLISQKSSKIENLFLLTDANETTKRQVMDDERNYWQTRYQTKDMYPEIYKKLNNKRQSNW